MLESGAFSLEPIEEPSEPEKPQDRLEPFDLRQLPEPGSLDDLGLKAEAPSARVALAPPTVLPAPRPLLAPWAAIPVARPIFPAWPQPQAAPARPTVGQGCPQSNNDWTEGKGVPPDPAGLSQLLGIKTEKPLRGPLALRTVLRFACAGFTQSLKSLLHELFKRLSDVKWFKDRPDAERKKLRQALVDLVRGLCCACKLNQLLAKPDPAGGKTLAAIEDFLKQHLGTAKPTDRSVAYGWALARSKNAQQLAEWVDKFFTDRSQGLGFHFAYKIGGNRLGAKKILEWCERKIGDIPPPVPSDHVPEDERFAPGSAYGQPSDELELKERPDWTKPGGAYRWRQDYKWWPLVGTPAVQGSIGCAGTSKLCGAYNCILQILCYSARPKSVDSTSTGLAVGLDGKPGKPVIPVPGKRGEFKVAPGCKYLCVVPNCTPTLPHWLRQGNPAFCQFFALQILDTDKSDPSNPKARRILPVKSEFMGDYAVGPSQTTGARVYTASLCVAYRPANAPYRFAVYCIDPDGGTPPKRTLAIDPRTGKPYVDPKTGKPTGRKVPIYRMNVS